ncbi:MAG: nucleotidyl transferase AbiEii/AbiGii toxin family protein [Candidatus Aureabacteria bacterium]|nr:nucleotidyl transferase AbiEii/AbiGii toxin family protein [Candidatus Auribacterota bacterium]MCK5161901.1 nucleotidyl transferase AbiEii/AbiGii toxin family protein [Candidatus Auribacterota bacterium]MCK5654793.1 nucleotidyl transferase AbiEii/AbiGii toxin family protein [Candidatus Auribacterota bacterium]
MIEVLRQQYKDEMSAEDKVNRVREFLQIIVLKALYEKDYFEKVAFTGGTALRVLYGLRRFSEDLDFSLVSRSGYDFKLLNEELLREFKLNGLHANSKPKAEKTVHSMMIKFPGLLNELGLSAFKEQNLSVKFEVDTNPPKGGKLENTVVNKAFILNIKHFDLSSLLATKLHACFFRKYTKGRDFYDLLWYAGKGIKPNLPLFNNAIEQTQGRSSAITKDNLKAFITDRIEKVDFEAAKKDVERFLEDKSELKLFKKEVFEAAVSGVC